MKAGILLRTAFLALALFSCQKDDDKPGQGNYVTGVFVVNEGPFGGSGSITWHNPATGETVQNIYSLANNGALAGAFVQSLAFHEGDAYIVVNGADKVIVADGNTFAYKGEITGLAQPRFFLPINRDKAYVSQWGADGLTGSIAVVDLRTRTVMKTIPTGNGPEKLLLENYPFLPRVLAPNSGGFGVDSTVTIINPDTDQVESTVNVGAYNPGSIARHTADLGGTSLTRLIALCEGYFLDPNPTGGLSVLDTDQAFAVPAYSDDLCANADNSRLYFTGGGKIWTVDYSIDPNQPLLSSFDQAAYGLAFDAASGRLYCADAKDFSSEGEVLVYDTAGNLQSRFPVGVSPGEIVFK